MNAETPQLENETHSIEYELSKTEWVKEAQQIPLNQIPHEEAIILTKCINKEQLNNEELKTLRQVLNKYRPAIQKIKPHETINNIEQNITLIEDEKTFLNLCDNYDNIQVIHFTYYIGDKQFRIKFDLYPLMDSTLIDNITTNLSLFDDWTQEETNTYTKIQNGTPLTPEEQIIQQGIQQKIQEATAKNTRQILIEYLASQLKFHNKNTTADAMKQVFSKIPDAYLSILFDEVQKRNHLNDIQTDKVFQAFD